MAAYPVSNFEIQKYYLKQTRFNIVYSRNNLPKIKDGSFETKLDKSNQLELIR